MLRKGIFIVLALGVLMVGCSSPTNNPSQSPTESPAAQATPSGQTRPLISNVPIVQVKVEEDSGNWVATVEAGPGGATKEDTTLDLQLTPATGFVEGPIEIPPPPSPSPSVGGKMDSQPAPTATPSPTASPVPIEKPVPVPGIDPPGSETLSGITLKRGEAAREVGKYKLTREGTFMLVGRYKIGSRGPWMTLPPQVLNLRLKDELPWP